MTTIPIPAAAVEAAAKALHEHDSVPIDEPWEALKDFDRDSYRNVMQVALAAAFGVGEIRQQWRVASTANAHQSPELHIQTEHWFGEDLVLARWNLADIHQYEPAAYLQSRYVLSVSGGDGWEITTAWRSCEAVTP